MEQFVVQNAINKSLNQKGFSAVDIEATKRQWKRYVDLYISDKANEYHHEAMASRVPYLINEIDMLKNKIELLESIIDEKES